MDSVLPKIRDVLQYWRTIVRSGLIGVFVGILPGVGEDMASWSSYAAAKRASREREQFGKGSVEGLMAAETGDNAAVPGALIPALALGIPGSAPSAVLMAAMIIHGAQPGPMLMVNQPQYIYDVVGITLVATLAILVFGLIMVRPILWVLRVPREIIMPIVFVLCVLGSYSITQRLFDVWVMLVTGIVCFLLRRRGFPVAPFVLGLVLGDIVDKSLRRGLVLSDGSLEPFFMRPISGVLAAVVAGHAAGADPGRAPAVSPAAAPQENRHDDDRSTGAVQRGAGAVDVRRAVRLCQPARLPRPRGRALHAGRRSHHHHRRAGRRLARDCRRPRAGDQRPALAAGCAARPVDQQSRPGSARAHRRRHPPPGRPVRAAGRQLPGPRFAGAAQSGARTVGCRRAGAGATEAGSTAGEHATAARACPIASSPCRATRPR